MGGALKLGDIICIDEPHYCYGRGRLILRITKIGQVEGAWINLMGIPLRSDGVAIRDEPRYAFVRVAAIRRYEVRR